MEVDCTYWHFISVANGGNQSYEQIQNAANVTWLLWVRVERGVGSVPARMPNLHD